MLMCLCCFDRRGNLICSLMFSTRIRIMSVVHEKSLNIPVNFISFRLLWWPGLKYLTQVLSFRRSIATEKSRFYENIRSLAYARDDKLSHYHLFIDLDQ